MVPEGDREDERELDQILARLEPSLGAVAGSPQELSGGITNRNFRVRFGEREYVVRRHGNATELLGIDRRAERLAGEAAARLALAPPVAASLENCLVTAYVDCRPVARDQLISRVEEIARALRLFHESSLQLPNRFAVTELLADYAELISRSGRALPEGYSLAARSAERIVATLALGEPRPCHNDLLAANIISACEDGRLLLVDWEYAGMGDPRFDLGNLSINNGFDERTDDRLLRAYDGREPADRDRAALKLMRVLSDAREGAWGALQAGLSQLDFDFEDYASGHFERLREAVERPQFGDWLATAQDRAKTA